MPNDGQTSTCTLGGFPEYAVNVSDVSQIQLAVNFARNANLRLVIKNTGHCYLGKSSGAGALSIWTHNLKDLEYLPDYDGPGYQGPAFKVGAGVTVRELYEAADRVGGTVLGGICQVRAVAPSCSRIVSPLTSSRASALLADTLLEVAILPCLVTTAWLPTTSWLLK